MESPYDVLGVDPDANERAVVEAYRRRVKEAHPDHGGSRAEFRLVRRAYRRIRDGEVGDGIDPGPEDPAGDAPPDADRTRGSGDGRAASPAGSPAASPGAGDDDGSGEGEEATGSRVEYLNYEVLADHGWDLEDPDLFEKAAAAGLDPADHGRLVVEDDETLLEAAERCGFAWPFACRGGACTNCAVAVRKGDIPVPPGYILPQDLVEKGIRLSCITAPTTGEAKVVYNVKHLPGVDDLRLPANRFERARSTD